MKGDGGCYYRCLSLYFTGSESNYMKYRREVLDYIRENLVRTKKITVEKKWEIVESFKPVLPGQLLHDDPQRAHRLRKVHVRLLPAEDQS